MTPESGEHLPSAEHRQHEIQDDEVVLFAAREVHRRLSVASTIDSIAAASQPVPDGIGQIFCVLDYEQAHDPALVTAQN